jgi:uncharacterized damage-inducible protein DinB
VSRISHVHLMVSYNASMNNRVYQAARKLPAQALVADRKAFFGSILGTLNHLVNADIISLPDPASLGAISCADIDALWQRRQWLDELIAAWSAAITEADLDQALHYVNSRGPADKNFFSVLMHFFNHQTHHRGQASTLLSQEGIDIGVTDLLALIADEVPAPT